MDVFASVFSPSGRAALGLNSTPRPRLQTLGICTRFLIAGACMRPRRPQPLANFQRQQHLAYPFAREQLQPLGKGWDLIEEGREGEGRIEAT